MGEAAADGQANEGRGAEGGAARGGELFAEDETKSLASTTLSGNSALGGSAGTNGGKSSLAEGGGDYLADGGIYLSGGSVTGNTAADSTGGAVGVGGLGLVNGQAGAAGAGQLSAGGGLFNDNAEVVLKHTEVTGNTADSNSDLDGYFILL